MPSVRSVSHIPWLKLVTANMEEKDSKKWFCAFLPLAWSGHIGLGLALGTVYIKVGKKHNTPIKSLFPFFVIT